MKNKLVPIAIISDNKIAFSVATLIINILKICDEKTFYEINVVVTSDFTEENIDKIKSTEDSNRCSINIIKMDDRFEDAKNGTGYISNAAAFRFCFGELFPQYSKILYLDTDIIVFEDLYELYSIDLGNNYIAGVFSLGHYLNRRDLAEMLFIPDLSNYVNSGVLLFNLEKIRENNIDAQLQSLVGTYKDSVDQHIFNRVCYGHIKKVHPKYNVTQTNINYYNSDIATIAYTYDDVKDAFEHPIIYHYTGPFKPWNSYNLKYHLIWYEYYKETPYGAEPLIFKVCPYGLGIKKTVNKTKKRKYLCYKFLYNVLHIKFKFLKKKNMKYENI